MENFPSSYRSPKRIIDSSTKVQSHDKINWTVVGQLSWQYLPATIDRHFITVIPSRGCISDSWYSSSLPRWCTAIQQHSCDGWASCRQCRGPMYAAFESAVCSRLAREFVTAQRRLSRWQWRKYHGGVSHRPAVNYKREFKVRGTSNPLGHVSG